MRNINRFTILILVLISLSCSGKKEIKVLKLAHGLDTGHPVHLGMEYMAKRLAEKSGGKLTIQIYPSAQLGGERECIELLQIGSLAITKVSAATMENFAPNFRVLGLPYLFKDRAHLFRVLNGDIGERLLKEGAAFRLMGLCYYDAGSRSFYTKDAPVSSPKDLEGKKIRVMKSATAVNMVNALGGSPTPISFGELYSALQQGVVDGAENNPPSFFFSRHYEVCKYYSLDEHTSVPDLLLVSLTWWNQLSDQEKKWLKEAALESVPVQRKLWADSEEASLKAVEAEGVTITYPDKSLFAELSAPLLEAYKDDTVKYGLIQEIKALADESKN